MADRCCGLPHQASADRADSAPPSHCTAADTAAFKVTTGRLLTNLRAELGPKFSILDERSHYGPHRCPAARNRLSGHQADATQFCATQGLPNSGLNPTGVRAGRLTHAAMCPAGMAAAVLRCCVCVTLVGLRVRPKPFGGPDWSVNPCQEVGLSWEGERGQQMARREDSRGGQCDHGC
jgi:hypothetical protein